MFGNPPASPGPSSPHTELAALSLRDDSVPSSDWQWERIVDALWPKLVTMGRVRYGLSREDSEDALQSVARDVMEYRPRAREPLAYLTTSFKRECGRVLKARAAKRREWSLIDAIDGRSDPRPDIDLACDVGIALDRISPRCRALITAHVMEGYTLFETADRTGLSRGNVWKRYQACLRRLIQWLP